MSPGSHAVVDGQPVTIVALEGAHTYYIPGIHYWTATRTDQVRPINKETRG
ncbi:hypothetical protein PBI_MAKEMAKE_90 [Mycobacterium phage Makemake]|uniref:hypothetical protein n=1 Tax=Mycobacterium phage Makemake TaxID=1873889 RepID=UPI00080F1A62|nr:hypothetical protein BI055_gp90 [Mycobacterium phage Makemake]ANT41863.1 hypothetical protein PBI_MAKEMAKE_90 [Mycobacterium phage Makemake]